MLLAAIKQQHLCTQYHLWAFTERQVLYWASSQSSTGNGGLASASNLPTVARSVKGRTGIWSQVCLSPQSIISAWLVFPFTLSIDISKLSSASSLLLNTCFKSSSITGHRAKSTKYVQMNKYEWMIMRHDSSYHFWHLGFQFSQIINFRSQEQVENAFNSRPCYSNSPLPIVFVTWAHQNGAH